MASQQKTSKLHPWSAARKTKQAGNWPKAKAARAARAAGQVKAHKHNLELIEQGLPTPWQQAKAKRFAARHKEST